MKQDTIRYDSLDNRPLPRWLTDQKAQSQLLEDKESFIREDHSLYISLGVTIFSVLVLVLLFTFRIIKRKKLKK